MHSMSLKQVVAKNYRTFDFTIYSVWVKSFKYHSEKLRERNYVISKYCKKWLGGFSCWKF